MGIQINGTTDTITATDGGLVVSGQQLSGVTDINASGIVTASQVQVGAAVTIASSQINVGSAVTVHTTGFQVGTSNLHSTGASLHNINSTGIITATSFSGDGSRLTGVAATANVRTNSLVVSGITTVAAGSTSIPSITPTGDNNTGIFFPIADTIAFAEGGTEIARFDSSGQLGIGTASVSSLLHVYKSGDGQTPVILQAGNANGILRFYNDSNGWSIDSGGDLRFVTSRSSSGTPERIKIDSNGRFGINGGNQATNPDRMFIFGASSDKYGLHLSMQNAAPNGASNVAALRIDGTQGRGLSPYYGISIDVAEIDVGSCYGIYNKVSGTYSNQYGFYSDIVKDLGAYSSAFCYYGKITTSGSGGVAQFHQCEESSTVRFRVKQNGGIDNYSANNTNLSDIREKKNISNLDSTWICLKNWELKKFHYNEDTDDSDLRYGVIAQQVAEHCPEVISEWIKQSESEAVLDEEGNEVEPAKEEIKRLGVKEQQMMWMAIKALQEAQERIETLEAKVESLKNP